MCPLAADRMREVVIDCLAALIRQLETDGPDGLLLPHRRAIERAAIRRNVVDPDSYDIAAAQAQSIARSNIVWSSGGDKARRV
jgi:hypothetical protein